MSYDLKTWFLGIFTKFLCYKSGEKWVPSNDCLSLNKIKDVVKCSEILKLMSRDLTKPWKNWNIKLSSLSFWQVKITKNYCDVTTFISVMFPQMPPTLLMPVSTS